MRVLLPQPGDAADVDIHAHYARDWVARGGVRVNFVASVDGAVTANGRSKGLQTPGDNQVFAALRDLADVVLVGAGTAVTEGYRRPHPTGDALERRREHGLPDVLRLAVLSRTGRGLTPDLPLFAAGDAPPPILVTTAGADVDAVRDVAEVIVAGASAIDEGHARRELASLGLTRVLCEGGPTVFAQWAAADQVDELCLSLSPLLAGPGPGRIAAGEQWPSARDLVLDGVLEEDGALFLRYRSD